MAKDTDNILKKSKYRHDAKEILSEIVDRLNDSHGYTGLIKILIDEIIDRVEHQEAFQEEDKKRELEKKVNTNLIERAEKLINVGLQKYPNDKFLLGLQADLTKIVKDKPQLLATLEEAFKSNQAATHIAIRLATQYMESDRLEDAVKILKSCKDLNPASKTINLMLAKTYMVMDPVEHRVTILHLLKRSFTEGDSNYESQVLYARHHLLYGEKDEAHRVFEYLKTQRFAPWLLNKLRAPVTDSEGSEILYNGWITKKTDVFCFVNVPTLGENVYIHYTGFLNDNWDQVVDRSEITFNLAFTVRGAAGYNARVV